jgi:hypothetical protein
MIKMIGDNKNVKIQDARQTQNQTKRLINVDHDEYMKGEMGRNIRN